MNRFLISAVMPVTVLFSSLSQKGIFFMKHLITIFTAFTLAMNANAATWGSENWGEALWSSISVNIPFPIAATGIIFLLLTLVGSRVLANKRRVAPVMLLGTLAIFSSVENAQAQFSVPTQFSNGTTIDAAEMNANFQAVVDELNALKDTISSSGMYTVHMIATGINSEPTSSTEEFGATILSGTMNVTVSGGACSISDTLTGVHVNSFLLQHLSSITSDSSPVTFSNCVVGLNGTLIATWSTLGANGGGSGLAVGVKVSN